MSKNEIRQIICMKPSKDPKADQLINSNINQAAPATNVPNEATKESYEEGEIQNGS
jgi:hypothetical protein